MSEEIKVLEREIREAWSEVEDAEFRAEDARIRWRIACEGLQNELEDAAKKAGEQP